MTDQTTLPAEQRRTPSAALAPFARLRDEIDRLFDDFPLAPAARSVFPFTRTAVVPAMELAETDQGYELSVELPGLEEKDIDIELADNATRIEAARLLTYRAAHLKDQGRRTSLESSMAKLYASEIAVRAAEDAVQIFGGYGFVKDYPAEKYFRDVKLTTIGEGTSEIQRLVIARQLLAE